VVVNCDELRVTVQGDQGNPDYVYSYTDDPLNYDLSTATWTFPAKGLNDPHTFMGLIPGRTYVFYVMDSNGCIRQSTINVNDIPDVNLPMDITETVTPSCFGMNQGSIEFSLNPDVAYPQMRWELYQIGDPIPVRNSGGGASAINVPFDPILEISSLPLGDYYLEIIQVNALDDDECHVGSENVEIWEQRAITAAVAQGDEIGCVRPGTISVTNINGGTGPYTFDV